MALVPSWRSYYGADQSKSPWSRPDSPHPEKLTEEELQAVFDKQGFYRRVSTDGVQPQGSMINENVERTQISRAKPSKIKLQDSARHHAQEPTGSVDAQNYSHANSRKQEQKVIPSRRQTPRMDLPMLIGGRDRAALNSLADSGSEENAMALDTASSLGLKIHKDAESQRDFRIGNGKIIKSRGRTTPVACYFARDPTQASSCVFFVFQTLVTPVIMGMNFLRETKTLSENRHRLQPRAVVPRNLFRACRINSAKQRLLCTLQHQETLVNADTGSDVDLLSRAYVEKRGFVIDLFESGQFEVQFADGSISSLCGKVALTIIIGNTHGPKFNTTFYVLEDLTSSVILGEDLLNETNAFQTYDQAFSLEESDDALADLNAIVWFRTPERLLSRMMGRSQAESRTGKIL